MNNIANQGASPDRPPQDWTRRQRVETTLNHQEPDRVPYDLGGSILTGIHHVAYRRLRRHLGLPEVEIQLEDPIQQLARVHDDVKERLQVDVSASIPANRAGGPLPPGARRAMTSCATNGASSGGNRRTAVCMPTCGGIRSRTLTPSRNWPNTNFPIRSIQAVRGSGRARG